MSYTIPEAEQRRSEDLEEKLIKLWDEATISCEPEAIRAYASQFARVQLARVGEQLMREGSFSIGRRVLDRAEGLQ